MMVMKTAAALTFLLGASLAFSQSTTVSFTNLNSLGRVKGINNSGTVVGYSLGGDEVQGFLYKNGTSTPLTVPGAIQTEVHGIEDSGRVVGEYNTENHNGSHGFLYFNGNVTTIDYPSALSTAARAINNSETIVGEYKDATGVSHGFSYQNGTFTAINVPSATATHPQAIDNNGDIAGDYVDSTGHHHGFVLPKGGSIQTVNVPFTGVKDTFVTGTDILGIVVGSYVDAQGTHGFVEVLGIFIGFDVPGISPAIGTLVGGINDNGSLVVFGNGAFLAQVLQ